VRLLGAPVILLRSSWCLFEILQYVKQCPDEIPVLKILHICFCSCHSAAVHFSVNICHSCKYGIKQLQYLLIL
jgi:hypothetical protein